MKLLVVDNYDSFVYNLIHQIRSLGGYDITAVKNDQVRLDSIADFDKILLSPGPGIPEEAGSLLEIIKQYGPHKSILGVCLGHQAIAEAFGGKLINLKTPLHGISSTIKITTQDYLFSGLNTAMEVGHYHSWVVNPELPNELAVTSIDKDGNIMSLRHQQYDIGGVQFHPESSMTVNGKRLIENWLKH